MGSKSLDLASKAMMGEELSEEEKLFLADWDRKYKLVQYLVMDYNKHKGIEMKQFHFTPGEDFADMSAIEVAAAIVNVDLSNAKPLKLEDLK